MRGVADEPPQALLGAAALVERRLDLRQHDVERAGEAADLGRAVLPLHAPREVPRRDRRRRLLDPLQRTQLAADKHVRQPGDTREHRDPGDDLEQHEPVQGRVDVAERHGDDEPAPGRELPGPAVGHQHDDAVAGGARRTDRGVDGALGEVPFRDARPERL